MIIIFILYFYFYKSMKLNYIYMQVKSLYILQEKEFNDYIQINFFVIGLIIISGNNIFIIIMKLNISLINHIYKRN